MIKELTLATILLLPTYSNANDIRPQTTMSEVEKFTNNFFTSLKKRVLKKDCLFQAAKDKYEYDCFHLPHKEEELSHEYRKKVFKRLIKKSLRDSAEEITRFKILEYWFDQNVKPLFQLEISKGTSGKMKFYGLGKKNKKSRKSSIKLSFKLSKRENSFMYDPKLNLKIKSENGLVSKLTWEPRKRTIDTDTTYIFPTRHSKTKNKSLKLNTSYNIKTGETRAKLEFKLNF